MINGIGASSGIAIAKAYKLVMPDLIKISVTFFVTESPSFHHQMMEIPIDMMEID